MSTIVTRSGKGSPLTHVEVDANFTNLNTDKYQEGSAIGGTTPAAGTFTTLTATGQTSLGGAAGSEGFRVYVPSTTGTWLGTRTTASSVYVGPDGTALPLVFNTNAQVFSFRSGGGLGSVSGEQFRIASTASAVNYVQVTGAATGNAATISAQGSDSNIFLQFYSKGSNGFNFYSGNGTGRQLRIDGGVTSSVNFLGVQGATTGQVPILSASAQSSDSNLGLAIQSKGTGAIDLAAGSSGVNISNGGTVTALTRTATGFSYTSFPSVAISAPTTAGGVQATAVVGSMVNTGAAVVSGGTGYTVGDTLTMVGGTSTGIAGTLTVTSVSGGVVTAASPANFGQYTVLPTNPVSVTGGTGSGATFTLTWGIGSNPSFTITNAGSGYVEQPTVSFSGGGGSGAAAFARVGGVVSLNSLGSTLNLGTEAGTGFRVLTAGTTATDMWQAISNGTTAILRSSNATANGQVQTSGTGGVQLGTNSGVTQCLVAHTASAVNYVQVTGAATGNIPIISAQGSDASVTLRLTGKGAGAVTLMSDSGSFTAFSVQGRATNGDTWLETQRDVGVVNLFAASGVTNGDIRLIPKGTGNVRFGTLTASADAAITGYIEIKDSGGTVRKLAVIA